MEIKIIGAILVIIGCGGFGFRIAAEHVRQERTLRELICALDYMECELQYRLTPLPELCRQASLQSNGLIRLVFLTLCHELEDQISPDASSCVLAVLKKVQDIPELCRKNLLLLGRSLGRFDMEGQLKGLEAVRQSCRKDLDVITQNKEIRLRSYQTLGLCSGAALAILFV